VVVGKTPMVLAPILVLAAVLFLTFWLGRLFERAGRRYAAQFIDPKTHSDLVELVRRVLSPVDADQACFLPEKVQKRARELLGKADEQAEARRRAEFRRRGF
jgi:hypothetical protein